MESLGETVIENGQFTVQFLIVDISRREIWDGLVCISKQLGAWAICGWMTYERPRPLNGTTDAGWERATNGTSELQTEQTRERAD